MGPEPDIEDLRRQLSEAKASLRQYSSLFDTIDQGFAVMEVVRDQDGRVVDLIFRRVNSALTKQTGLTGDIIGKTILELLPTYDRRWLDVYASVAETGKPQRVEDYAQAVNRWYNVHFSAVDGPRSTLVATIYEDVTERKKSELTLRDNESRLRLASEAAELGVFEWNPSNDTVSWENDRMFEIFGRSREDGELNVAMFMADVVHADDAERFKTELDLSLTSGQLQYTGRFYRVSNNTRRRRRPGCGSTWVRVRRSSLQKPSRTPASHSSSSPATIRMSSRPNSILSNVWRNRCSFAASSGRSRNS